MATSLLQHVTQPLNRVLKQHQHDPEQALEAWHQIRPLLTPELAWDLAQLSIWSADLHDLIRFNQSLGDKDPKTMPFYHHFWLDLLCMIQVQQPQLNWPQSSPERHRLAEVFSFSLQDARSKQALIQRHQSVDLLYLNALHLLYPARQKPERNLVAAAGFYDLQYFLWAKIMPYSSKEPFDQHYLLHLLANLLQGYLTDNKALYKPPLVVALRRFMEMDLEEFFSFKQLMPLCSQSPHLGYQSLFTLIQERLISASENQNVQKIRDQIHKKIYPDPTQKQQPEALNTYIVQAINLHIKKYESLSRVDAFMHDYQENRISYSALEHTTKSRFHWFQKKRNRNGDWINQKLQPPGHNASSDPQISPYTQYQNYSQQAAEFWAKAPPHKLFQRFHFAEHFETLWISEGEIWVYALIHQALNAGADLSRYFEVIFGPPVEQTEIQQARLDSVQDACERLLLSYRTTTKPWAKELAGQQLRFLVWQLFPGFAPENVRATLYANMLKIQQRTWSNEQPKDCQPPAQQWLSDLNPKIFQEQICPYPAFLYESELRTRSTCLMHGFFLPLIYEKPQIEVAQLHYLPAAFLTGLCFETPLPRGSTCLPFVASVWKHKSNAIAQIARYLIDHYLIQMRHEEKYKTSVVRRFGIYNQQVLGHLFQKDRVLGQIIAPDHATPISEEVKAAHRPDEINPALLHYYFQYAGSGKVTQELPPQTHFLGLLSRSWNKVSARLKHDPQQLRQAARIHFAWLKIMSHDAENQESTGHVLRMAQLFQTLWLVHSQWQQTHPRALIQIEIDQIRFKSSKDRVFAYTKDLSMLLTDLPFLTQISANQGDALQEDTRSIGYPAPLAGQITVLSFCALLLDLLTLHLQPQQSNGVQVLKVEVKYRSLNQSLCIIITCKNSFSEAARLALNALDRYGDFRKTLHQLALALNPEHDELQFIEAKQAQIETSIPQGLCLITSPHPQNLGQMQTQIILSNQTIPFQENIP